MLGQCAYHGHAKLTGADDEGGVKMRRQRLATATVRIFIRTNPFKAETQYTGIRTVSLPVATSDTTKLARAALLALRTLYRPNLKYK